MALVVLKPHCSWCVFILRALGLFSWCTAASCALLQDKSRICPARPAWCGMWSSGTAVPMSSPVTLQRWSLSPLLHLEGSSPAHPGLCQQTSLIPWKNSRRYRERMELPSTPNTLSFPALTVIFHPAHAIPLSNLGLEKSPFLRLSFELDCFQISLYYSV